MTSSSMLCTKASRPQRRAPIPKTAPFCVGAHISASGGCLNAVKNARAQLGPRAGSFAFFVRPRLTWKPQPPIPAESVERFKERVAASQFSLAKIVVHGSYLINFGSHDAELRRKSVELMVEEVDKCEQLGISLYVFHPGSSTGHAHSSTKKASSKKQATRSKKSKRRTRSDSESQNSETSEHDSGDEQANHAAREQARAISLDYVAACVSEVLNRTHGAVLVLENTCGHGNVLGRDFAELRQLLDAIHGEDANNASNRIGVCLDTCHAFASGYAMDSAQACDEMMADFDEAMGSTIWTDVLKVVHVNDSRDPAGSKRDRHANIGEGTMGMGVFRWLMRNPRFAGLPLILETPRSEKPKKKKRKKVPKSKSDTDTDEAGAAAEKLSAREEVELLLDLCDN